MSRRVASAALGALLLGTASLAAQDSAATLARMERRLDSLRAVLAAADSTARSRVRTDTVIVGSLRIATTPALRPAVQRAAAVAWERLGVEFGGALSEASLPAMPVGSAAESLAGNVSAELLADALERTAARVVWGRQDSTLVRWLSGYLPADAAVADGSRILASLVGTPAIPNAGCLGGAMADCALALGLGAPPPSVEAWYAPAAWPGLVERDRGSLDSRSASRRADCIERADMEACRAVLSLRPPAPPVAPVGRALLAQLALESGGSGAFERLTSDPEATLGDRLASAARQPLDSLLAGWLRTVRHAPPSGAPAKGSELLIVLAWSCPALLLSLRGSRCR
ncbi:MAG TPA: hypothetical protein VFV65_07160 [Gemmatimonadales bacterium]|nr:hypothetical protein [Gemmatimonadales bacterium]